MMDAKLLIYPLQRWLLGQGRCVGCGRPLREGKKQPKDGVVLITCRCERIFVYQSKFDSFRRALFEELD